VGGVGLDSVVRGFGSVIEATTLKMAEHERVMRSEGPGIEGTETHCARGPFDRTLSFSGPCENNAAKDILSTGCLWRAIPKDLPPKSSVYGCFDLWTYDGTLERMHYALYEQCRERERRDCRRRNLPKWGRSQVHGRQRVAQRMIGNHHHAFKGLTEFQN